MDIPGVELKIEEVLSIHRQWITKLYIEDSKTEAEIVDLLYEHRFFITYGPTIVFTHLGD